MNKYKILVFDLDDTLIDNLKNVKHAFAKILEIEDHNYSEKCFERWFRIDKQFWSDYQDGLIELPEKLKNEEGKNRDELLDWVRAQRFLLYFNNDITLERAIEINNIYMNALKENVIEIDGAHDTLEYLSKQGYRIVIATNGPKVATREKITKIGCSKYVNEIFSADMFGYMKPDKRFGLGLKKAINNFNTDEYLIIGDSLKSDVGLAMECNFDSCWFNKNGDKLNSKYKPTMIITKLNELINIL